MDLDDFRMILSNSRVDVWELIDAAITVASMDYGGELKDRRDLIVERLYTSTASRCRNCDVDRQKHKASIEKENSHERQKEASPSTPQSLHVDDDDEEEDEVRDPYGGLFEDEETKILRIKERLEDLNQSEDSLVELLQTLADMDITFKALKETDIGRHVNRLRKHSSNDVRRLVKQLVRKWKDLVDEWVKLNSTDELASSTLIADGDSPQQGLLARNAQNGHHQVPDFAYSPNPHNGSSGSDRNNSEPEPKAKVIPRRDAPAKPPHSSSLSASAPPPKRQQKESSIDLDRLASARKRLQENYQEAQNGYISLFALPFLFFPFLFFHTISQALCCAERVVFVLLICEAKRQRTIQVMDIHEIPKPKNTFFAKNRGGPQGRHR